MKKIVEMLAQLAKEVAELKATAPQEPRKEWYTTSEAADELRKKTATITQHCRRGSIKSKKDGPRKEARFLIPYEELERLKNGGAYLQTGKT